MTRKVNNKYYHSRRTDANHLSLSIMAGLVAWLSNTESHSEGIRPKQSIIHIACNHWQSLTRMDLFIIGDANNRAFAV